MTRAMLAAVAALLLTATGAAAHAPGVRSDGPDRFALRQAAEPSLASVPRPDCGPGSRPEGDMQGRVPPGAPAAGYACNIDVLGRHGETGGYKTLRYVDKTGRECAYYDTTLLFPSNAQSLSEQPTGVAVLDMTDPARPVRTTSLGTPAMQTPHESLILNQRRGLLAAVMGNPAVYPGVVDVYDLSEDCRYPQLQSSLPVGVLGHESGFAPDGNTFYATSIATGQTTAVDVSNPKLPRTLWVGSYGTHGLTVSDDGNRAYLAESEGGLVILDVSEIQARRPNPQVREVSRLSWPTMTIPQIAHPVTIDGKPYIVEVDEFSATNEGDTTIHGPRVGAARIIDISDERAPRVVSNIRLAVHQPENRPALEDDPGTDSPVQGYAGHYCNVPRREDPGILACSFILSGLRVFDIRDPERPREVAYHVAPLEPSRTAGPPANYAMSSPEFVRERGEIWYTDGNYGFFALRVRNGAWPGAATPGAEGGLPAARRCTSRRSFAIHIRAPRGQRLRRPRIRASAGRVRRVQRYRRGWRATVDLRGVPRRTVTVRLRARTSRGRTLRQSRTYRTCRPRRR